MLLYYTFKKECEQTDCHLLALYPCVVTADDKNETHSLICNLRFTISLAKVVLFFDIRKFFFVF